MGKVMISGMVVLMFVASNEILSLGILLGLGLLFLARIMSDRGY